MTTRRPVRLVAYDPAWPEQAQALGEQWRALGPALVAVHHIGSTAIPGLLAKPVIDLLPVVVSLAAFDESAGQIEALGYSLRGENGIAGRRYCTLDRENGARRAQAHVFAADDPHIHRHLAFRDYLCAHPDIARAYAAAKRRACDLNPEDSRAYTAEKAVWIEAREAEALRWSGAINGRSQ